MTSLLSVLREPAAVRGLSPGVWDLLLRQAASADVLATLGLLLQDGGLFDAVPAAPRAHLEWACTAGVSHARGARHEVDMIAAALQELSVPLILLKGGAYAMAGLDAGRGRLFSDIDILVPKERLHEVEAALMLHGWASTQHDEYDQRYYREWMRLAGVDGRAVPARPAAAIAGHRCAPGRCRQCLLVYWRQLVAHATNIAVLPSL